MKKYFIITIATVITIGISWYGFANGLKMEDQDVANLNEAGFRLADETPAGDLNNQEKQVIAEIQKIFAGFAENAPLYISGSINAVTPTDSIENTAATSFTYYHQHGLLYYTNSEQTLLNDSIAYSVADHNSQQLLVMPARSMAAAQALPLGELSKFFNEDNYQVERKEEDGLITYRLFNDRHISCKEVRIEVKADSQVPTSINYRLTNLDHPEEKEWDKELTLHFTSWQTGEEAKKAFTVPRLVQRTANGYLPAKPFEAYDITDLSTQ